LCYLFWHCVIYSGIVLFILALCYLFWHCVIYSGIVLFILALCYLLIILNRLTF
jgi:hypothetical protein